MTALHAASLTNHLKVLLQRSSTGGLIAHVNVQFITPGFAGGQGDRQVFSCRAAPVNVLECRSETNTKSSLVTHVIRADE